ncbi:hypothetical protein PINS_up002898 [Pythium insidiosum]|nr:hypothetical protein PINS_up002898 [Pythium insidiosum]
MVNMATLDGGVLQCAAACDDWLYVGDSDGALRAFHCVGAPEDRAIDLSSANWTAQVSDAGDALLCLCAVRDPRANASHALIAAGCADGAVVFYRNHTETRRLRLPHAVTSLLAIGDLQFVATDAFGHLYGLTLYDVTWQLAATDSEGFYARTTATVRLLDIEGTLSTYVLVALWDRPLLLVTQRDRVVATIATSTPIRSILSVPSAQGEDVVLVAGHDGSVSRVRTVRSPKTMSSPSQEDKFEIIIELVTRVDIAIRKIVAVQAANSLPSATPSERVSWLVLGEDGQIVGFEGGEQVEKWSTLLPLAAEREESICDTVILRRNEAVDVCVLRGRQIHRYSMSAQSSAQ